MAKPPLQLFSRSCVAAFAIVALVALGGKAFAAHHAAHHEEISLSGVPHYASLSEARAKCGSDAVAWANLRTDVYHLSHSRWFGKTKHGAYFCKASLDKKGVRRSRE